MKAPRIRDATAGDGEAVAVLLTELGYPATPEEATARIQRFAGDPQSRVQVAEVDGRVAGLVATHLAPRLAVDRLDCEIVAIVVASPRRGEGIGGALLDAAEAEARSRGARRLELSSGDWRPEAHGFYLSRGFVTEARSFTKLLARVGPRG